MAEGKDNKENHHGYNKDWFVKKETALQYLCETCGNVLNDPRQIIKCGHQFCLLCLPKDIKKCPTCDVDVKENEIVPDTSAKNKVIALDIDCPGNCNWKGTLGEFIQEHKSIKCPFDEVQCTNEDCKNLVIREKLEEHLQEQCQYRKINCQHCGYNITIANEKNHYDEECLKIDVDCPQSCGNKIPREKVQQHIDNDCENRIIDCTFKAIGCEVQVEHRRLREHERDMVDDHLAKSVHVINTLVAEKQAMTGEIRQLKEKNDDLTQELRDLRENMETRTENINSDLQQFKEIGQLGLENNQRATEQNFDRLNTVSEQLNQQQEALFCIQNELVNASYVTIPEIQAISMSNQAVNTQLANNQGKLQKMIVACYNKLQHNLSVQLEEIDTKLNNLRDEVEVECRTRLEGEARTAETILKQNEELANINNKLENVKMNLAVTQDEMKEKFLEHCQQMQLDYNDLSSKIRSEKQRTENNFLELNEDIAQMNSKMLVWRVNNVESVLDQATPLYGKRFYSEPYGYVLQPKIFFNGARLNDQGYLSIFIRIMKGSFDEILKWPFSKHIRVTLIEQESSGLRRNIEKILVPPSADAVELRKPSEDSNNGFGIYKFVSHEVLQGGRYIVNDEIFIKIEVLEESEHSKTL